MSVILRITNYKDKRHGCILFTIIWFSNYHLIQYIHSKESKKIQQTKNNEILSLGVADRKRMAYEAFDSNDKTAVLQPG